jgi:hypothetical protein
MINSQLSTINYRVVIPTAGVRLFSAAALLRRGVLVSRSEYPKFEMLSESPRSSQKTQDFGGRHSQSSRPLPSDRHGELKQGEKFEVLRQSLP